MRWIRPQLQRFAAGWLVCHLCLLAAIPTTLRSTMFASASGAACTCAHGDGQICPMHHTRSTTASTSSSRPCSCRSTADPMTAMAASLIGPAAVLAPSASCVAPATSHRLVLCTQSRTARIPLRSRLAPTAQLGPSAPTRDLILMQDQSRASLRRLVFSSDGLYVNPWFGHVLAQTGHPLTTVIDDETDADDTGAPGELLVKWKWEHGKHHPKFCSWRLCPRRVEQRRGHLRHGHRRRRGSAASGRRTGPHYDSRALVRVAAHDGHRRRRTVRATGRAHGRLRDFCGQVGVPDDREIDPRPAWHRHRRRLRAPVRRHDRDG